MCTTTDTRPELKIAKEDIITYKHMNSIEIESRLFGLINREVYISLHKGFMYRQNKVYKTVLDNFGDSGSIPYTIFCSERGFYSWESKKDANVKCIIPKGAKYYHAFDKYDKRWIYTSNKIKIIGRI